MSGPRRQRVYLKVEKKKKQPNLESIKSIERIHVDKINQRFGCRAWSCDRSWMEARAWRWITRTWRKKATSPPPPVPFAASDGAKAGLSRSCRLFTPTTIVKLSPFYSSSVFYAVHKKKIKNHRVFFNSVESSPRVERIRCCACMVGRLWTKAGAVSSQSHHD